MDSKELRGLMEAYAEVYAPQQLDEISQKTATSAYAQRRTGEFELWVNELVEEGYDLSDYTWNEMYDIYEAIYSEKGKAKAAEMIAARSTPSGRAKAGKGENVAQIKHIVRSEREGLRGTPMTPTMAKNPAKSRTFGGTGNKAARRAGLTPTREKPNAWKEDFELWVNELVEEGYDLSDYTWNEMYEFYLGEAITSEKGKAKAAEMIAKRTTASGRAKSGQGDTVATIKHIGRSEREGLGGTPATRSTSGSNRPKSYSGIGGTGNKAARRAGLTPTREKPNAWKEDFELWVNELVEEGYDLSDYTWNEMYDIYEAEKPFPYEKVTAQQKKHTAAGRYGNMMKMGLAKRRAKEAEKTGGSQRDAGKGWYHGR